MSEQVWWYATRAAGLMTWSSATASVVVGLLVSTRAIRARSGPWFLDLHRYLGGVSVIFLVTHLGALYMDSYVDFGPRELFVPGASGWEPEAIAWGIIGAYVLIAVELTSLLRSRMRTSIWRVVHGLSIITVGAGSYHAYLAGSDVRNPVTWSIAGLGSVLVIGLIAVRLHRHEDEGPTQDRLDDRESVLIEMRQRLEELPAPDDTPQPELATSSTGLPRRAPVGSFLGAGSNPAQETEQVDGFTGDPFAATEPDSFPYTANTVTDPPPVADDEHDLFDDVSSVLPVPDAPVGDPNGPSPFADSLSQAISTTEPVPAGQPDLFATSAPTSDLFAHPAPDDPTAGFLGNPFDSAVASTISITKPIPTGPPPLPTDAVDPITGAADEAAYTAWLKDWLAYAERYGDEAPEDPARV